MWGREVFNKRMEVALPVSGSTSGADVLKKQLRSIGKTFAMMCDTEIRDVVQSTNLPQCAQTIFEEPTKSMAAAITMSATTPPRRRLTLKLPEVAAIAERIY